MKKLSRIDKLGHYAKMAIAGAVICIMIIGLIASHSKMK